MDGDGDVILLKDQDRSLWDRPQIGQARTLIQQAYAARRIGTYALQAEIAACHAEAARFEDTDWGRVTSL